MDATSKRLLKELRDFQTDSTPHSDILSLHPIHDNDILLWCGLIQGPSESPYVGGRFELLIKVPATYPMLPPSVRFETRLCHPNVHPKSGEICLDILKAAWSPAWTLKSVMVAVLLLLVDPEPASPLNVDAANLLRCGDKEGYDSLVRMYTELYAMGHLKKGGEEEEEEEEKKKDVAAAAAAAIAAMVEDERVQAGAAESGGGGIGRSLVQV